MTRFNRSEETRRLDDYLANEAGTIGLISMELRARGVPEAALDEAVHERADNVSDAASEWASENVNNSHIERQIAFILQEDGKVEGKAVIEAAAVEWLAENGPVGPRGP